MRLSLCLVIVSQRSIDDGDNTWAFMLRKLAFVFIIMALDKLKSRSDDLTVKAQCKAMVPEFEGATSTLYLKEDMSSILLNHFTGGHQLSSQFHEFERSYSSECTDDLGAVIIRSVDITILSNVGICISVIGY